ncbi:MAG: 8-oxoguanine deaminase, partial [Sulfitobacter sp.]
AALLLAGPTTVRDLLVEGRRVVRDRQICTIDLPALIARQNKLAQALKDCL